MRLFYLEKGKKKKSQFYRFRSKVEDYRNLRIAIQAMTVFSRSRYLLTTSHFHRKTTAPALRFKLFSYYQELKKKKKCGNTVFSGYLLACTSLLVYFKWMRCIWKPCFMASMYLYWCGISTLRIILEFTVVPTRLS